MTLARTIFSIGGIWGIVVLTPLYFLVDVTGRRYGVPTENPHFFYGFLSVAMAWQLAFLVIASSPARYRPLMIPAILEKLGYAAGVVVLYGQGRLSVTDADVGRPDLLLAALFHRRIYENPGDHGQRFSPDSNPPRHPTRSGLPSQLKQRGVRAVPARLIGVPVRVLAGVVGGSGFAAAANWPHDRVNSAKPACVSPPTRDPLAALAPSARPAACRRGSTRATSPDPRRRDPRNGGEAAETHPAPTKRLAFLMSAPIAILQHA